MVIKQKAEYQDNKQFHNRKQNIRIINSFILTKQETEYEDNKQHYFN